MARTPTQRTCPRGHIYIKSTDCPTCPKCEQKKSTASFVIQGLGAPARRALQAAGVTSLKALAKHPEADVLAMHGMGPSTLPKLRAALKAAGLSFKA